LRARISSPPENAEAFAGRRVLARLAEPDAARRRPPGLGQEPSRRDLGPASPRPARERRRSGVRADPGPRERGDAAHRRRGALGAAEAEFFHLLNLTRESGASVLMTAQRQPDLWGLATPDLISRLRLAPVVTLGAPDLELLRACWSNCSPTGRYPSIPRFPLSRDAVGALVGGRPARGGGTRPRGAGPGTSGDEGACRRNISNYK